MSNMNTTVNRMRLDEVVAWFSTRGYKSTASYFLGLVHDDCTIMYRNAYWVDTKVLYNHLGDRLFNEMECDVVTWMPSDAQFV